VRREQIFAAHLRTAGDDLVLVTSDQRLLKAAQAEGMLYPELQEKRVITPVAAVSSRQVQNYLRQVRQFVNLVNTQLGL